MRCDPVLSTHIARTDGHLVGLSTVHEKQLTGYLTKNINFIESAALRLELLIWFLSCALPCSLTLSWLAAFTFLLPLKYSPLQLQRSVQMHTTYTARCEHGL